MDEEDEWFFSSIKRYSQLQMFDFDKSAQQIDLSAQNNLCVALEGDRNNKCEILICSLPSTLQSKQGNNEVQFDRNLSFNHGYFTDSPFVQMKCLPDEENLIISEKNGVGLYDISCEDTDIIRRISSIPCNINRAKIAVHPTKTYIAVCGLANEPRSVINYSTLSSVFNYTNDEETTGDLSAQFVSPDVISYGNTVSGSLSLYDLRTQALTDSVLIPDVIEATKSSVSRWVFNATYGVKSDHPDFNDNLLYLLSTNGNFLIYDRRNLKETVHYSKHPFDCESKMGPKWGLRMSISPMNLNRFLICGFDENVYVCLLEHDKITTLFTHDGHPYSKDEFEPNVMSLCAIWLPFVSPDTVASCADNTSLQCWQFLA